MGKKWLSAIVRVPGRAKLSEVFDTAAAQLKLCPSHYHISMVGELGLRRKLPHGLDSTVEHSQIYEFYLTQVTVYLFL